VSNQRLKVSRWLQCLTANSQSTATEKTLALLFQFRTTGVFANSEVDEPALHHQSLHRPFVQNQFSLYSSGLKSRLTLSETWVLGGKAARILLMPLDKLFPRRTELMES